LELPLLELFDFELDELEELRELGWLDELGGAA
jgi:hypothetical protein